MAVESFVAGGLARTLRPVGPTRLSPPTHSPLAFRPLVGRPRPVDPAGRPRKRRERLQLVPITGRIDETGCRHSAPTCPRAVKRKSFPIAGRRTGNETKDRHRRTRTYGSRGRNAGGSPGSDLDCDYLRQ